MLHGAHFLYMCTSKLISILNEGISPHGFSHDQGHACMDPLTLYCTLCEGIPLALMGFPSMIHAINYIKS